MNLEKDEKFEMYLASFTPTEYVKRLARATYYGRCAFITLFPEYVNAPPEIVNRAPRGPTGPTSFVRFRYASDTFDRAMEIVRTFRSAHPGRSEQYWACP